MSKSKADQLLEKFGDNISESIGVQVIPGESVAPKQLKKKDKFAGRRRDRNSGREYMELDRVVADPMQPRKQFDKESLKQLAEGIKEHGVLLPISVRWDEGLAKWLIVDGERRYRASKLANMTEVPCTFQENLSDDTVLVQQLLTNLQREDLRPMDQANAFSELRDRTGWSTRQLAARVNLSQGAVTKSLALLSLPDDIQRHVDEGEIGPTVAYQVSQIADESQQRKLAGQIIKRDLTRDQVIERAKGARASSKEKTKQNAKPVERWFELTTTNATFKIRHVDSAAELVDLEKEIVELQIQLAATRRAEDHSP